MSGNVHETLLVFDGSLRSGMVPDNPELFAIEPSIVDDLRPCINTENIWPRAGKVQWGILGCKMAN